MSIPLSGFVCFWESEAERAELLGWYFLARCHLPIWIIPIRQSIRGLDVYCVSVRPSLIVMVQESATLRNCLNFRYTGPVCLCAGCNCIWAINPMLSEVGGIPKCFLRINVSLATRTPLRSTTAAATSAIIRLFHFLPSCCASRALSTPRAVSFSDMMPSCPERTVVTRR